MKHKYYQFFLMVFLIAYSQSINGQTFLSQSYTPDVTNFANPERGFYHHTEVKASNYSLLNETTLKGYRNEGITLIIRVFYLELFLNSPISTQYLTNVRKDFATARKAGVKIITRFAYTQKSTSPYGDATPDRVLQHIAQLGPILKQNSDVITVIQAGFIGAWGEWYYTDHFSQTLGSPTEADWVNRRKVVDALVAATSSRLVQVRTPDIKRKLVQSTTAIASAEAFGTSAKARVAHHNDCFLASADDYGTYNNLIEEKAYLEEETKYLPMGGETCGPYVPLSECPNALAEMKRFHWSYLNRDYHPTVLSGWTTNGCMPDVQKKLGYRYRLTKASLQQNGKPGGSVAFDFAMVNDGWANVFNARTVEIVLKNTNSGKEYRLKTAQDPRRWNLSDTIKFSVNAGLPSGIELADYQVYINLPDAEFTLSKNPLYSIHLANTGVWQSSTGYNDLQHTLVVSASASVPTYNGSDFFLRTDVLSVTLAIPSPLQNSVYANNVILYWGQVANAPYRVVERSSNGSAYQEIAILSGDTFVFTDASLSSSTNYSYRSYGTDGFAISAPTSVINVTTKVTQPPFYNHKTDGQIGEWETVEPITAIFDQSITLGLRLFTDRDSLFTLNEGTGFSSFGLYLDTDNNPSTGSKLTNWANNGFDYLMRNDSLYESQSDNWAFVSKFKSKASTNYTEAAVKLAWLKNLNQNLIINVAAIAVFPNATKVYLPLPEQRPVTFIRSVPPVALLSFEVGASSTKPESQLTISWQSCASCLGYILERSTSATSDFNAIADIPRNTFIYYDDNLTKGTTYYYRVAAYSENGLSVYTPVLSGTPNVVTGIEADRNVVSIFPNPVNDIVIIEALIDSADKVRLYDLQGREISLGTSQRSNDRITYLTSHIAAGTYLLRIYLKEGEKDVRMIKL
jgi:Domain of unknown function (DUF4832)/Domain of unknown function (DUF4874)/Secretion system C-terminal sorting domain